MNKWQQKQRVTREEILPCHNSYNESESENDDIDMGSIHQAAHEGLEWGTKQGSDGHRLIPSICTTTVSAMCKKRRRPIMERSYPVVNGTTDPMKTTVTTISAATVRQLPSSSSSSPAAASKSPLRSMVPSTTRWFFFTCCFIHSIISIQTCFAEKINMGRTDQYNSNYHKYQPERGQGLDKANRLQISDWKNNNGNESSNYRQQQDVQKDEYYLVPTFGLSPPPPTAAMMPSMSYQPKTEEENILHPSPAIFPEAFLQQQRQGQQQPPTIQTEEFFIQPSSSSSTLSSHHSIAGGVPPEPTVFYFAQPKQDEDDSLFSQQQRELQQSPLPTDCRNALLISDSDRNNRMEQDEYVVFVNQIGGLGNQYRTYNELPAAVRLNFQDFVTTEGPGSGTINVQGSKPGDPPSPTQLQFLIDLCDFTEDSLIVVAPPAPSVSPNGVPTPDECVPTIPRQDCYNALAIGDLTRDNDLNDEEYVRFINRLTDRQYNGYDFQALPGNLKLNFIRFALQGGQIDVTGSKPGIPPTPQQEAFLAELCCATEEAIDDPGVPTPPIVPPTPAPMGVPTPTTGGTGGEECENTIARPQCNSFLSNADEDRNNLLTRTEYVTFLNRLSGDAFDGFAFNSLPSHLTRLFNDYASNGNEINIFGSRSGQFPGDTQDDFLDSFCCDADNAVNSSPNPPTLSPGGGGGSDPPTFEPVFCEFSMAISDLNKNDYLSESEYVRFLNRLTRDEFAGLSFTDLEEVLRRNYNNLVDTVNGGIPIFGSKPGQNPDDDQQDNIERVCLETAIALNPSTPSPNNPGTTPAPAPQTDAPTKAPAVSLPPTFLDTQCRTSVGSSDFDRDDYLNQVEYVVVLNRLTRNQFRDLEFNELEVPLPQTFFKLTKGGDRIYIFGARPGQTASDEQEQFILDICLEISLALNRLGETFEPTPTPQNTVQPTPTQPSAATPFPTESPPSEPTTPAPVAPTLPPGIAEVFNSFIVGNDAGLLGKDLQTGLNRAGLDNSYRLFTEDAVRELGDLSDRFTPSSETARTSLRGRKLIVTLQVNSDSIYVLMDSACPEGTKDIATCQTAFAKFRVRIEWEDPDEVQEVYTTETQRLISEGFLQAALDKRDPTSVLYIVNSSFPVVTDYTLPPTPSPDGNATSPTSAPDDDRGPADTGGVRVGPIVGGVLAGFLVCALIGFGWLYLFCCGRGGRGGAKPTGDGDEPVNNPDDNKDDDGSDKDGNDFGLDDNDGVGGGGGNGFGKNGQNNNGGGGGGGETKNKFGFGKKNKQSNNNGFGDNAFGLEGPDNAFGADSKDDMDFSQYGFDEPSETKERDDNNADGGSVGGGRGGGGGGGGASGGGGGNADSLFDTPESPGWGTAGGANFFGTANGWGTNDSADNSADNFFGTSAFAGDNGNIQRDDEGDEEEEESEEELDEDEDYDREMGQPESGTSNSHSRSDETDSYTSSDDSTYESDGGDDTGDDDEEDDYSDSRSSVDDETRSTADSASAGSMDSSLRRKQENIENLIDEGNWEGVAAAAQSFDKSEGSSMENSSKRSDGKDLVEDSDVEGEEGEEGGEDFDDDDDASYSGSSQSGSVSGSETTATTQTEEREKRDEYRAQVEALVRLVLPDESDKVDAMMDRFKGREAELVSTLQTMQERSAAQRARAAVHKSKTRPQRTEGQFRADAGYNAAVGPTGAMEGSTAGTAAIAAASLPIPAAGLFDEGSQDEGDLPPDEMGFDDQDAFGDQIMEGEEGSYYDEEGSASGSYYDEDEGSRSYYSGEEDGSRGSRSFEDGEGEEGSYYSGDEGGSQQLDDGEGPIDEEGSQSYYSGEDEEGSYYEDEEEVSFERSDEEGPFDDEEGPFSDEEGPFSDEEEGSYIDGEEGPFDDEGEGPFSDEGSYSDEGGEGQDDGWQ